MQEGLYELTVRNADKGSLALADVQQRLRQFKEQGLAVVLTQVRPLLQSGTLSGSSSSTGAPLVMARHCRSRHCQWMSHWCICRPLPGSSRGRAWHQSQSDCMLQPTHVSKSRDWHRALLCQDPPTEVYRPCLCHLNDLLFMYQTLPWLGSDLFCFRKLAGNLSWSDGLHSHCRPHCTQQRPDSSLVAPSS